MLIWLRVEHFDELVERLGGNQVPFDKGPFFNQQAKQWEVWFKDPDGYRIVLSGPSEYPVLALRK
ncbi:hypothetical protein [Pasteurella multocida]|uniref:hypothetical protein n=1 Tax=Pasteurella multocida TaxID=747 RepID=UPI0020111D24|nr:hypothetical protein [Pasteurella multocida]